MALHVVECHLVSTERACRQLLHEFPGNGQPLHNPIELCKVLNNHLINMFTAIKSSWIAAHLARKLWTVAMQPKS